MDHAALLSFMESHLNKSFYSMYIFSLFQILVCNMTLQSDLCTLASEVYQSAQTLGHFC